MASILSSGARHGKAYGELQVTVSDDAKLRRALATLAPNVQAAVVEVLTDTAEEIVQLAKENLVASGTVDTANLGESIHWFTRGGLEDTEVVVGTDVPYANYVEFGTGVFAGNSPVRMPPPAALREWAERHGMPGAEWAIAKSIEKAGGLMPRPFLYPAFEVATRGLWKRAMAAAKRAARETAED